MKPRRLKIVSNGTASGTHVVDESTGESIYGVLSVEWKCGVEEFVDSFAIATITLMGMAVELTGAESSLAVRLIEKGE